jgi:hypothetical protein
VSKEKRQACRIGLYWAARGASMAATQEACFSLIESITECNKAKCAIGKAAQPPPLPPPPAQSAPSCSHVGKRRYYIVHVSQPRGSEIICMCYCVGGVFGDSKSASIQWARLTTTRYKGAAIIVVCSPTLRGAPSKEAPPKDDFHP